MSLAPTGSLPDPTIVAPIARSCREVIDRAGQLTAALADDPLGHIESLKRVNPALADHLFTVMDSVMDLDVRTGFLASYLPD